MLISELEPGMEIEAKVRLFSGTRGRRRRAIVVALDRKNVLQDAALATRFPITEQMNASMALHQERRRKDAKVKARIVALAVENGGSWKPVFASLKDCIMPWSDAEEIRQASIERSRAAQRAQQDRKQRLDACKAAIEKLADTHCQANLNYRNEAAILISLDALEQIVALAKAGNA